MLFEADVGAEAKIFEATEPELLLPIRRVWRRIVGVFLELCGQTCQCRTRLVALRPFDFILTKPTRQHFQQSHERGGTTFSTSWTVSAFSSTRNLLRSFQIVNFTRSIKLELRLPCWRRIHILKRLHQSQMHRPTKDLEVR